MRLLEVTNLSYFYYIKKYRNIKIIMISNFLLKKNKIFPITKLLKIVLSISIICQIIIVTYNHLSGYHVLNGFGNFFIRLFRGTSYSFIAGLLIAIPDLYIIKLMNNFFGWNRKIILRILLQLAFTIVIAVIISTIVTIFANYMSRYEEPFKYVLLYNALIYSVVNIIIMAILEATIFFTENDLAKQKTEKLQREFSQVKFEMLKNQINPHFLFNSLNVLSGLIEKDPIKAQLFLDEFSHIYRYVLETIEKPIVTLNDEIRFVRSYIYLQQIRYGNALELTINLPASIMKFQMPPLSLQVVLENAIKHNIIQKEKPLHIHITYDDGWLSIKNNIQEKLSSGFSSGLGQKNLVKRYAMICKNTPIFNIEINRYIVKLPLINNDYDESCNN